MSAIPAAAIPGIAFGATALTVGTATLLTAKGQDKDNFALTVGATGAVTTFFSAGFALEGGVFASAVAGAGVGAVLGAMLGTSLKG